MTLTARSLRPYELLSELRQRGVLLSIVRGEDGQPDELELDGPRSVLTPKVLDTVRRAKVALLMLLREEMAEAAVDEDDDLCCEDSAEEDGEDGSGGSSRGGDGPPHYAHPLLRSTPAWPESAGSSSGSSGNDFADFRRSLDNLPEKQPAQKPGTGKSSSDAGDDEEKTASSVREVLLCALAQAGRGGPGTPLVQAAAATFPGARRSPGPPASAAASPVPASLLERLEAWEREEEQEQAAYGRRVQYAYHAAQEGRMPVDVLLPLTYSPVAAATSVDANRWFLWAIARGWMLYDQHGWAWLLSETPGGGDALAADINAVVEWYAAREHFNGYGRTEGGSP